MSTRSAVAYIRVSTVEQDEETQIREISDWAERRGINIVRWYIDKISGALNMEKRPMLRRLINDVPLMNPRPVFFLTYDISRLARSIEEFFKILHIIENELNLVFIPVKDLSMFNISPELRPVMRALLATFAALERELIRRRVHDSMVRARRDGKIVNIVERLERENPSMLIELCRDYSTGTPLRTIARRRGLSYYAVWRIVNTYCRKNMNTRTCTRCGHRMVLEDRSIIDMGDRVRIREVYYCRNCGNRIEIEV
ncbi:MAG: recombinase family protein [Crenarchaeota archaeon]|nr:recombinase family protein [Thermoproteota archaeon]